MSERISPLPQAEATGPTLAAGLRSSPHSRRRIAISDNDCLENTRPAHLSSIFSYSDHKTMQQHPQPCCLFERELRVVAVHSHLKPLSRSRTVQFVCDAGRSSRLSIHLSIHMLSLTLVRHRRINTGLAMVTGTRVVQALGRSEASDRTCFAERGPGQRRSSPGRPEIPLLAAVYRRHSGELRAVHTLRDLHRLS